MLCFRIGKIVVAIIVSPIEARDDKVDVTLYVGQELGLKLMKKACERERREVLKALLRKTYKVDGMIDLETLTHLEPS